MKKFLGTVFLCFCACGCAVETVYNPLQTVSRQTVLFNEEALGQLTVGMKQQEVHDILGREIIIGYAYQNNTPKPITLANPYKSIILSKYTMEYYVTAVHQPHGVVTDDELMPLAFHDGKLAGKGWDFLRRLQPPPARR